MATLLQIQMAEEKWRTNNTAYGTLTNLGVTTTSLDGYYTIAATNVTGSTYTLTATAQGAQTEDSCGNFVIDQNGQNYTGTNADATCWGK